MVTHDSTEPRSDSFAPTHATARQATDVAFLPRVPFVIDALTLGFLPGFREDCTYQQAQFQDLECPDEIRQRTRTLAEQAEARGVTTGVHPAGFAAACLYKAGREESRWMTQSEAADVANASTATVRAHRDTLEDQVA